MAIPKAAAAAATSVQPGGACRHHICVQAGEDRLTRHLPRATPTGRGPSPRRSLRMRPQTVEGDRARACPAVSRHDGVPDQGSRRDFGRQRRRLARWADKGRIASFTDDSGRQAVHGVALAQLAQDLAEEASHDQYGAAVATSMRNRFLGLVTHDPGHGDRPGRDSGRAAPVRLAGQPEAVDELGLEPGMLPSPPSRPPAFR